MRFAETGYILEVDLTRGNIERVATDPKETELYLGGEGSAARMLWERFSPEADPFSPANLLIFSAGLLDGTPVPGANRTTVSTVSPQTNLYVSAGFSGFFGPELKHAGYDKIVIRGKSRTPVYLSIRDNRVELRDASHLAGKSALETTGIIQKELKDPNVQVAAIGIAGENRVFQATIDHANSSASRGVGVVMGDKGLKAIAVRGTGDLDVARAEELFSACNAHYQGIYDNPRCGDPFLRESDDSWHVRNHAYSATPGTITGYFSEEIEAQWKVRVEREETVYQWENYSQEMEEHLETIVEESKRIRGTGCFNCPKNCHEAVSLPGGRQYFLKSYSKLAYATLPYPELKLNYELLYAIQEYGLDEAALPQVIDFAVKLYEAGMLTDQDLPEFPADSTERTFYLLDKIARRDGVGDHLANGLYRAARAIGKGADKVERCVKMIEQVPLKRAALDYPYFLMYATGGKMNITQVEGSFPQLPIADKKEREAFANGWEAAPERFRNWFLGWEPGQQLSVEAAVNAADWNEAMHTLDDALGTCPLLSSFRGQFGGRVPYHMHNLPQFITMAAGIEVDTERLMEVSRRNRAIVRSINAARGLKRGDETVPEDLFAGADPELEQKLLDAYYEFRGWTREGVPSNETLNGLGLQDVGERLIERGILAR